MDFLSNPFFYADIDTLLVDLNFKHYLHTDFNTVLTPNGFEITSFLEVEEDISDLFVASIDEDEDNTDVLNKIKNIISLNLAVSKKNEYVKIYLNSDESAHSVFPQGNTFVEVKSTTIETIFDEHKIGKCDLMKIDCEGAEYEIIDSIPEKYFSRINKMIIEYHLADKRPELYQNLLKKLEIMLFKIKTKKISEGIGMIYATR